MSSRRIVLMAVLTWVVAEVAITVKPEWWPVIPVVFYTAWAIFVLAMCITRGHRLMFWIGVGFLLLPPLLVFPIIGTFRLARPDSRFAQKHYDERQIQLAQARYGEKGKWSL